MSIKDYNRHCNELQEDCGPQQNMSSSIDTSFPIEIYTFVDPLCPECWAFEPILKKLQIEYGHYFRIRYFVSGKLKSFNGCCPIGKNSRMKRLAHKWKKTACLTGMSCDDDIWFEDPISSPYITALAIKAAEMQGRQAGIKFMRKIQECLFLDKKNISKEEILIECAKNVGLDIEEFQRDLHSEVAIKALNCDLKATREMGIDTAPTFVFFNNNVEEEGLKVEGLYSYDIYVEILTSMLGFPPIKRPKLSIEQFLEKYKFVATKEIAVVFDLTMEETDKQLKKLLLKQKVEKVPVKYGTFWRYKENSPHD